MPRFVSWLFTRRLAALLLSWSLSLFASLLLCHRTLLFVASFSVVVGRRRGGRGAWTSWAWTSAWFSLSLPCLLLLDFWLYLFLPYSLFWFDLLFLFLLCLVTRSWASLELTSFSECRVSLGYLFWLVLLLYQFSHRLFVLLLEIFRNLFYHWWERVVFLLVLILLILAIRHFFTIHWFYEFKHWVLFSINVSSFKSVK